MKYRIRKYAKGWAVQKLYHPKWSDPVLLTKDKWRTLATHRHHWLASLHLWWLRERRRK